MTRDYYYWDDCSWISEENTPLVCDRLASLKDHSKVPYGVDFDIPCFDRDLIYQPMRVGKGLTCASFVLSIFDALEYRLIDYSTWQKRDSDREWQEMILAYVSGCDQQQAEAMKDHIGAFRFRPEEVTVAALASDGPLSFSDTQLRTRRLLDQLASREAGEGGNSLMGDQVKPGSPPDGETTSDIVIDTPLSSLKDDLGMSAEVATGNAVKGDGSKSC